MSTNNRLDKSNFGERLKKARKRTGITQAEFAKRIGVAKDTFSRYERGELSPSLDVLSSITMFLNDGSGDAITTDWLLFGNPEDLDRPPPSRVPRFGSLVGMRFPNDLQENRTPGAFAEVLIDSYDIARLVEVVIQQEEYKVSPDTKKINRLKKISKEFKHLIGDDDFDLILEVMIAQQAVKITPYFPLEYNDIPLEDSPETHTQR